MAGMNRTDMRYAGDFGTPEQEIPPDAVTLAWESCMTMNDTWGFKSTDDNWKSADELIDNLVDIAAKGGNFLLNVGPTAEGLIPEPSVERLQEMGAWLRVNGEAIYGSELLPHYAQGDSIRYTSTGGDFVYAVALEWPGSVMTLEHVEPEAGSEIYLLGYEEPLEWSFNNLADVVITLPEELQDESARPAKYAFVFKIRGEAKAAVAG
jgi:alpha-L-fucosidase